MIIFYRLAARLYSNQVALIALALLSFSPFHLAFAQENRAYSLLALLSICHVTTYLNWRNSQNHPNGPNRSAPVAYFLTGVALLYTHYFGAFTVAASALHSLLAHSKIAKKNWLRIHLLILLSFAPWITSLIWQIKKRDYEWIQYPEYLDFAHAAKSYFWTYPGAVAFMVLGLWALLAKTKTKENEVLLFTFAAMPVIVPVLLSWNLKPIFFPKYAIGGITIFYLMAARGLSLIGSRILMGAAALVLVFSMLSPSKAYLGSPQREDWREIVQWVDSNWDDRDILFFDVHTSRRPFFHYTERALSNTILFKDNLMPSPTVQLNPKSLTVENFRSWNRVWLVRGYSYLKAYEHDQLFSTEFIPRLRKRFANIEVTLYENFRSQESFALAR